VDLAEVGVVGMAGVWALVEPIGQV